MFAEQGQTMRPNRDFLEPIRAILSLSNILYHVTHPARLFLYVQKEKDELSKGKEVEENENGILEVVHYRFYFVGTGYNKSIRVSR